MKSSFQKTLKSCHDYNFSPPYTAETCWNEGYKLGRSRWWWGPPSWSWLTFKRMKYIAFGVAILFLALVLYTIFVCVDCL